MTGKWMAVSGGPGADLKEMLMEAKSAINQTLKDEK